MRESLFVVVLFIETHDSGHALGAEVRNDIIYSGGVVPFSSRCSYIMWTGECQETPFDDPVHIAILNTLIVFVLIDIK